jgi:hypothetical protein
VGRQATRLCFRLLFLLFVVMGVALKKNGVNRAVRTVE